MPRTSFTVLIIAIICALAWVVFQSSILFGQPGDDGPMGGSSRPTVSLAPHDKGHPPNAFKGEKRALAADLYAFKIFFYGAYRFEKFTFNIYVDDKNRGAIPGKNFTLWKDVDEDGKVTTPKDELLSEGVVEGTSVVFSKPFTLSSNTSFIVRGDFPILMPGLVFALNIDKGNTVIKNEQGIQASLSFTKTIQASEHYEPFPLLEARSSLRESVVVGGQDVVVFVDVAYLRSVEPYWADLHSVRGWTLKGYPVMSEVTGFDLLHRRISMTISQPQGGIALGAHALPELTLRYRDRASSDKILTARIQLPSFRKEVVHVEVRVPLQTIAVGDPLQYERQLFLDPGYTVPDDYLNELGRSEFWGDFRVSAARIIKAESENERIITYRAVLSYLGPPVKTAVLPEEKIPYVKADGSLSSFLVYKLPAIEFPFRPVATGKSFASPDLWRMIVEEEHKFFGVELGWWMVILPMGMGGFTLLLLGSREAVRLVRWRRQKPTTFIRQFRAWRRIRRFLMGNGDNLPAFELSSLVREYIGSVVGQPRDFVRSARFSDWFRKRYPEEPGLLETLKRTELAMIQEGLDIERTLTWVEREAILRSLVRISRKERSRRWKEKGVSVYVVCLRRFGFGK